MATTAAIIGLGIMGRRMLENMEVHPDFQTVALWDPAPAACQSAQALAPNARIAASPEEAIAAADLIYLVCTPEITSLHLAKRKIDRIRSLGIATSKLRLLLNRSGSNRGLGAEQIEKITGVPVQWALDNDYRAVTEAALRGGLVPRSTALFQQLEQLGDLVLKELGAPHAAGEGVQKQSPPARESQTATSGAGASAGVERKIS